MLGNEFAHLVDGLNAIEIALALRHSPGEQPMSSQDEPFGLRMIFYRLFNQHRQFKSRTLPRQPHDGPGKLLVELVQLLLSIGARRQRNRPVRMQVVNVSKWQES